MASASSDQVRAQRATAARPAAPPRRSRTLIAVLGALTAVSPLATDMYVPGFPELGASLRTSSSAVQLTMTAFLAGLVAGQLLIGPLSDGLGRRRLLLGGLLGFTLTSLCCAFAPHVGVLTGLRFLQGLCGAAGMVLARAIVTDLYHGRDLPRYFAILSQILGIAPVVAPVLGGGVLAVSGWRAVFGVLALFGVLLLAAVVWQVPESLPPERRHRGGLGGTFRTMARMAGQRSILGYTLTGAGGAAALFAYISGSSFVFQRIHGVSPTVYSLIFAVNSAGALLGGTLFSRLAARGVRLNRLLVCSVAVSLLGGLAQVLLVLTVGETLAGAWITLFVVLVGIGMMFPAGMSLGQMLGRAAPGAVAALMGATQFLCGALAAPLVGLFGETSSLPMALVMGTALLLAMLALLVLARPWLGHGEVAADRR